MSDFERYLSKRPWSNSDEQRKDYEANPEQFTKRDWMPKPTTEFMEKLKKSAQEMRENAVHGKTATEVMIEQQANRRLVQKIDDRLKEIYGDNRTPEEKRRDYLIDTAMTSLNALRNNINSRYYLEHLEWTLKRLKGIDENGA